MHVVERQPYGVIAGRGDLQNCDILLAADGLAFGRRMTLHLGARAFDPQIFSAQLEFLPLSKRNG